MRSIVLGAAGSSRLENFLSSQRSARFSYPAVGMTRELETPPGFVEDLTTVDLGRGSEAFAKGKAALSAWRGFQLGWLEVFPRAAALREGNDVCVAAKAFGVTFLNACRIAYVVDEPDQFGFAYGTLPAHAQSGEELFVIERRSDAAVLYRIRALSRPNTWYARLGYPASRRLQRRFAEDSAAAMKAATS